VINAMIADVCPRCGAQNYKQSLFCDNCRVYLRDDTQHVERVTYNRRFWGSYLLDNFLLYSSFFVGLAIALSANLLFLLPLSLGWFAWFFFTSKTGQTPAKRLLDLYVIKIDSGRGIGQGESWLREVVVKILALGAIGFIVPFASLVDAVWIFFDKNRQTLHDKLLGQLVVYAPIGLPEGIHHLDNAPTRYALPGAAPATVAAAPGSVQDTAAQLRELARLRDEGVITAEEYEAKRAALINRM
jgi:uncharacterized RDD family membrane protein YckC